MPRRRDGPAHRSRWYPFDAPSRRQVEELRAADPLLGSIAAWDRQVTIHVRWITGIQVFTLGVIAVLANR